MTPAGVLAMGWREREPGDVADIRKIAVIGGGAKAAALCAKAYCLNQAGRQLSLQVFEAEELGAAWTGRHGYTDGEQRLCTPAERDVGFPYERGLLNSAGVQDLFREFSWNAFLVAGGGTSHSLRDWVDRGRKPPPHSLYAEYLRWVIERSKTRQTRGVVTALRTVGGKWSVTSRHPRTARVSTFPDFDAVVLTGPGPALRGFDRPEDPRIIDGVGFWRDPESFLAQAEGREGPIVVAGSGGTAAAIAAWIARRNRPGRPIIIVGNQAALFTRTESFFENALFSDEDAWGALPPEDRVGVSQRLNRGVVWASVSDVLSASPDVRFRPGRVLRAVLEPGVEEAPEELTVHVRDARGERGDPASLVIDAAGFDAWWFAALLPERLRRATVGPDAAATKRRREELAAGMNEDLSLKLAVGLHAPMLSLAQGPGFASLMVLGAMSERILQSYANPVT